MNAPAFVGWQICTYIDMKRTKLISGLPKRKSCMLPAQTGDRRNVLMTGQPLMPKATAVWLVDNTALTFEQIAAFCGLHVLEVKGIADGQVAQGIKGMDPVSSGQLTREEIARAQEDPSHRLKLATSKVQIPEVKMKRRPKYTPVSRRQDRPNAILWLLRNHPELKDAQIMRLVGTTKPTIQTIRDRSHWNMPNLQPADPVTLGLCRQIDLDAEVGKAAKRLPPAPIADESTREGSLQPVNDKPEEVFEEFEPTAEPEAQEDTTKLAERAFARFSGEAHDKTEDD